MASGKTYKDYEVRKRDPDPSKAVLLVIDMQECFRDMVASILPSVNTTISLCRARGMPVIYTRHAHRDPSDYGVMYEWWGELIKDGTPESQLMSDLSPPDAADTVIVKQTYSAFLNTGLDDHLRKLGKTEVIVIGVMTNLCCETSARDAFIRGFRVFFSTDATATATATPDLHDATLRNLAYGFAYLVDCPRLQRALA